MSFLTATSLTTETGFQCQEIQRVSSTGKMLINKKVLFYESILSFP